MNSNFFPFGYRPPNTAPNVFVGPPLMPFLDQMRPQNEILAENVRFNRQVICSKVANEFVSNSFNDSNQRRVLLPTPGLAFNGWSNRPPLFHSTFPVPTLREVNGQWIETNSGFTSQFGVAGNTSNDLNKVQDRFNRRDVENKPVSDAQSMNELLNMNDNLSPYGSERDQASPIGDVDLRKVVDMIFSDEETNDKIDYEQWLDEALDKDYRVGNRNGTVRPFTSAQPLTSSNQLPRIENTINANKRPKASRNVVEDRSNSISRSDSRNSTRVVRYNQTPSSNRKQFGLGNGNKSSRYNSKRKVRRKLKGNKKQSLVVEVKSTPLKAGKNKRKRVRKQALVKKNKASISVHEANCEEDIPEMSTSFEDLESASFEQLMAQYQSIQEQLKELAVEEKSRGISESEACVDENHNIPDKDDEASDIEDAELLELRRLALVSRKVKAVEEIAENDLEKIELIEENIESKPDNVVEEDDELALRQILLNSLSCRKSVESPKPVDKASEPLVLDMIVERIDSPGQFDASINQGKKVEEVKVFKPLTEVSEQTTLRNERSKPSTPLPDLMPKEKLIIHFGDDSSEDEEVEASNATSTLPPISGIDGLLKEARLKSQSRALPTKTLHEKVFKKDSRSPILNKLSVAQQMEYQKLKEEIARREQGGIEKDTFLKMKETKWKTNKALLEQKRQKLFEIKSKVIQKRIQLRKSQNHARKMQEMYAAATKIVATTAAELNKFNSELKLIDVEVQTAEKSVSSLEKDCVSFGVTVRGKDYKLPVCETNKTKKMETPIQKKRLLSESEKSGNKMKSNQQLADEKKRLNELKLLVSERLQILKRPTAQQKTGIDVNVHNKQKEKPTEKTEKMKQLAERTKRFSKAVLTIVNRHLRRPYITNVSIPYEYKLNFATYPSELRTNCSNIDFQMPIYSMKTETSQFSQPNVDVKSEDQRCVLSHLHSYRLSHIFEKQAIRYSQQPDYTSTSYSNAINPHEYLCRFDLMGTCNDEKCPWQHSRNYSLTSDDKLLDLLLYKPSIAQVDSNSEHSSNDPLQQLQEFVAKFRKQHNDCTEYELKQLLVKLIRSSEGEESPLCTLVRSLPRVKSKGTSNYSIHTFDDFKYGIKLRDSRLTLTYGKVFRMKANIDPDNYIKNRFFAPEGRPLSAELETTLASDPNNIQLWVKLAYYHVTRNPSKKADCINRALNVLSRGLESNQMNAELWEHFLILYANRVHSQEDPKFELLNICRKVVSVCPHHKIWKMYLSFCVSFEDKDSASSNFLESLSSGTVLFDENSGRDFSHCLLEVISYKVRLFLETGLRRQAEDFFRYVLLGENDFVKQDFLSSVEVIDAVLNDDNQQCKNYNSLTSLLTLSDRVFVWLCYLYFCCFQTLPNENFDVLRQGFSGIAHKSTFVFEWKENTPNEKKISEILSTFKTAIDQCLVIDDMERYLVDCLPLIVNVINLQVYGVDFSIDNGIRIYDKLIDRFPRCSQLRILKAQLLIEHNLADCAVDTLKENLINSSDHLNTYYLIATIYYEAKDYENCRRTLHQVVSEYFSCSIHESELLVAYRCLMLDEEISNEAHSGQYKPVLKFEDPSRPIKLWLCYLLVHLIETRPESEIEKCFQHAISLCKLHVSSETEINLLWWLYLRHSARDLSTQWHLNKLISKLRHCCLSVTDCVFQVKLIEFFAKLFSSEKERFIYYVECVNLLPENLQMVQIAYNLGSKLGEKDKCYNLLKSLIAKKYFKKFDASIWKSVISLAIDRKDHFNVHRYFQLALSNHPYNKTLWRLMLVYETSLNHRDHMKEIRSILEKLKLPNIEQQNKQIVEKPST